jgi:hypothetical protein
MNLPKHYHFRKVALGNGISVPAARVRVEVLELTPQCVKSISKNYEDGRILSLQVVDEILVEKSMTYTWAWDYDVLERERKGGATVGFKFYEKNGLEVGMTYYGTYLVGKMITLTPESKVKFPLLFPDDWHDELESDISFPLVDINKIELREGYSPGEKQNQRMAKYWEEDIIEAMETQLVEKESVGEIKCEFCGDTPCVWLSQRDTVMEIDINEHGGTSTANNTRRKVAYKHMYQVVNGIGQKGIRLRHSECVETGVRALFPDEKYMGFREA